MLRTSVMSDGLFADSTFASGIRLRGTAVSVVVRTGLGVNDGIVGPKNFFWTCCWGLSISMAGMRTVAGPRDDVFSFAAKPFELTKAVERRCWGSCS